MITVEVSSHEYNGPHGSEENARLDVQHNGLRAVMGGKIVHANLSRPPTRILDIGCGSGIVSLELAEMYPSAEIIAIDVATPARTVKAENVRFIQGSFNQLVQNGSLEHSSFDYIFGRLLILGITDWKKHTTNVFSLLKPGGIYEVQDLSWDIRDKDGNNVWDRYPILAVLSENAAAKGINMFCGDEHPVYLKTAGFEDIQHKVFPWPLQYWPEKPETKGLAYMMQEGGFKAFSRISVDRLLGGSGKYTTEQVDAYKTNLEYMFRGYPEGTHNVFGVTSGRKPSGM